MHPITTLLRVAAPYIGLDPVIMVVIVGLIVWTVYSGVKLQRAATSLRRRLEEAIAVLQPVSDAPAFATNYETLSTRLEAITLLDIPWRGYKNSLIVPTLPGRLVTATAEPRTWFDLAALFRDAGADLRYHAALPGLLVGAGLLYTFLGLAAALSLAGDVVQSGSDHARTVALHDLLGAASAKFITSVCGLFLSIGYIHLTRWWNPAVEDQCTARVLRIGQEKPVSVHIPMAVLADGRRSFDQNLHQLLQRKRHMMRDALLPSEADPLELSTMLGETLSS